MDAAASAETEPADDARYTLADVDVAASLARLAEQSVGLQRQLTRMEAVFTEQVHAFTAIIREAEARITALTDAKFVTYDALLKGEAEKVALALEATEKAIDKAEAATSKAIDKAEAANSDRFAAVNEFRGQLNDQARTFMPRTEAVQLADQSSVRIRELADRLPTLATREEVRVMTDRYSERIGELNDRMNRKEGQGEGAKDNRAGIYAAIAAAVGLISIIIIVANMLSN